MGPDKGCPKASAALAWRFLISFSVCSFSFILFSFLAILRINLSIGSSCEEWVPFRNFFSRLFCLFLWSASMLACCWAVLFLFLFGIYLFDFVKAPFVSIFWGWKAITLFRNPRYFTLFIDRYHPAFVSSASQRRTGNPVFTL